MDAVRDLGRVDPWQASLERSLARRRASGGASVKREERRHTRPLAPRTPGRRPAADGSRTRRRTPARSRPTRSRPTPARILVRRTVAIFTLTVSAVVLVSALAGQDPEGSPTAAQARALPRQVDRRFADSGGAGPFSRLPVPRLTGDWLRRACRPSSGPSHYVNPLGGAHVMRERVDQGVDYAGSGTLVAIGGATVTYVARTNTGWPGSFIEYRLLDGPDAGCYVYYAEGVNPVAGLRVGQRVAPGQPMARIISGWPTGIELGWGAGISTATYAAEAHQWSATRDANSVASGAGKSFSDLISSLGGPAGKVEG